MRHAKDGRSLSDEKDRDLKALVELGLIEPAVVDGEPGYRLSEAVSAATFVPNDALVARLLKRRRGRSEG